MTCNTVELAIRNNNDRGTPFNTSGTFVKALTIETITVAVPASSGVMLLLLGSRKQQRPIRGFMSSTIRRCGVELRAPRQEPEGGEAT
jgi:hypothetical protein